ncbi:c-x8-c-x5-c-x3-h type zinc finger protein [Pyrenophora tritici-repentis]|nr:c-x8-c-x5-c-x3-h type zinc finger protein [Pyrenophora tritici-repentis]KAI1551858.1 c-x8-c-x5-c-x3-h type zinc finger protein [Pyrenophora tritici-repentis]KAI1606750.1 c-x8-c-x5-c-x3-h type zinc finger protein [Pyrenophora tritici-repentis]PZD30069.1 PAT1 multi-domain protein [Pyrenophora tritici-repentis]PZD43098.1 PAT1 multi-domain protein [Pyrenophora tritici-repentis]
MASNHVPSDQVPIQGQNVYDPSYQHLFSSYGGQFSQQPTLGSYGQPSNVDPSLGLDPNAIRQQQQSPYQMPMRTAPPQSHGITVTPQALQHHVPSLQARATATPQQQQRSTAEVFTQQRSAPASFVKPVPIPEYEIPKGRKSGGLYVVDQAALAKATNSVPLNKFVTLGSEPFHLATNRTALPVYVPRQSLKDLKKAGADSKKLRAKQLATKSQSRALKSTKRPDLKREVSDSESSTDSSDYDTDSSDEEEEQMPVPASRPEDPDAAVRYDVIKATWYPSTSVPSSDQIKTSMREIWEVLNTIQKRWRADTKAVTEAEEQKKTGELPVLKSRVTSQRDLLKSALGAALESAHPDVLYQLGHIKPFLYLCYQFLANRFHSKDYDGPLSAVIYEVLSRCGTLTSEVLEETKLLKALASMKKHANEKHKAFIQKVIDGAVANSKKAKASPPPRVEPAESKGLKRSASEAAGRSLNENPLMKKPKAPEASVTAKKDVAGAKTVTASTTLTVQKRPGERAAAAPAPVKTRVSQVTNKPSGIFASLTAAAKKTAPPPAATTGAKGANAVKTAASATKEKKPAAAAKPAFSFAQTMASLQKPKEQQAAPVKSEKPLPVETEQEKEKRERKERRRHLRVSWRNDATLVEIKYFDHEADDEEMHHKEDHLVRDAGDIGGEGHMFKQHKELDLDDDDEELDTEQKSWNPPSLVDFSVVRQEERERNYMPYGGGFLEPSCPEKEANVQRENATLMVYYSNTDDIPPSPKEPLELAQEDAAAGTVVQFGTPPDMVLAKCPQAPTPATAQDFSHLENLIKQLSATNAPPAPTPVVPVENVYTPPQPPTASWDGANIQNILNSITNSQAAPQPAPPVSFPSQPPMPQPGMPLDIAAIIANMQAASGGALPPPPPLPTGFPPFPFPMAPQPQQPEAAAWSQQIPDVASYQAQYNQQVNGGVKRQRDDSNGSNDRNQGKRPKNRGDHKPHKVLACKFFHKGQCNKGENCTYIHDLNPN